jgi:hypothetical protein
MGNTYSEVGGPNARNNVSFSDPTGNYGNAMNQFKSAFTDASGSFDPQKAMNAFLGQSEGLTNMVAGQTGPVGQMLREGATRNAKIGGEAALAAMGGPNSGAGMGAFGDAYSRAFSDAATQTQQAQLGLLSPLLNQNLSSQYGLMGQGMQQYGDMASKQGDLYTPTYERNKNFWDYTKDVVGMGLGIKSLWK